MLKYKSHTYAFRRAPDKWWLIPAYSFPRVGIQLTTVAVTFARFCSIVIHNMLLDTGRCGPKEGYLVRAISEKMKSWICSRLSTTRTWEWTLVCIVSCFILCFFLFPRRVSNFVNIFFLNFSSMRYDYICISTRGRARLRPLIRSEF